MQSLSVAQLLLFCPLRGGSNYSSYSSYSSMLSENAHTHMHTNTHAFEGWLGLQKCTRTHAQCKSAVSVCGPAAALLQLFMSHSVHAVAGPCRASAHLHNCFSITSAAQLQYFNVALVSQLQQLRYFNNALVLQQQQQLWYRFSVKAAAIAILKYRLTAATIALQQHVTAAIAEGLAGVERAVQYNKQGQ